MFQSRPVLQKINGLGFALQEKENEWIHFKASDLFIHPIYLFVLDERETSFLTICFEAKLFSS